MKQLQTEVTNQAKALLQFCENEGILDLLCSLKSRWNDEKAYEDFSAYQDVVKAAFDRHSQFKVQKMTKRFVVTVSAPVNHSEMIFELSLKVKGNRANFVVKFVKIGG